VPTGIKDIAVAAGVSMATVSRVLAGKSVRPAYRARVEEAMRGVDYRPNLAARRLRAPDAGAVGIIVPDLTNSFFASFVRMVEDLAWAEGLRVIICDSNEDSAREKVHRQLLEEERVSGLLLAPVVPISASDLTGPPTVLFDRAAGDEPHDTVMLDNEAAAGMLAGSLHQGGAGSILGLFGDGGIAADARERGFISYVEDQGIEYRVEHIPFDPEARRAAVQSAIGEAADFDAIVAVNDDVLLEAAIALGVGTDRTLASFDEAPWLRLLGPKLRVVAQPVGEMAHAALAMLVERMAGNGCAPRRVVFRGNVA
jgi:LacI family fructose operon transcriptional repressor